MRIAVTGATGLIGRALVTRLAERGDVLNVLGRRPPAAPRAGVRFFAWEAGGGSPPPLESLEGVDAVVNLAGEPIAQRWTPQVKRRLRSSRVDGTTSLVGALAACRQRPAVLISASAVGYYGSRGDTPLGEDAPPGTGFLAGLCVDWESAANAAAKLDIRVACLRTGVVLDRADGALKRMVPLFKAGVGGPVAGGRQWMPWIHLADVAGLIEHAIGDPVGSALNVVSPHPATNAEFSRALGKLLHRPAVIPVPALALKTLYGEMAEVVLASTRALPRAALAAGYVFRFPDLMGALGDVLG
jgi:uncharacterized protein